jgi:parallel beta-helix repeat protein
MIPAVLILPILFALGTAVRANPDLYVDIDAKCGGILPCYTTIQAAVNVAVDGDTIYVFPGTYDESVDLSDMDPDGNITLVTVDDGGIRTPGTVTVSSSISGPHSEFYTYDPLDGDIAIEGFNVHSALPGIDVQVEGPGDDNHNVVIRHVTATNIDQDGIKVVADGDVTIHQCTASHNGGTGIHANADGNVTISHCTASDNAAAGIYVWDTDGDVTISDCTANSNRGTYSTNAGISVAHPGGQLMVSDCDASDNANYGIYAWTVGGTVTLSNCSASDNDSDGVRVEEAAGNVSLSNVTANGNGNMGFEVFAEADLTFEHCTARGNDLYGYDTANVSGTLTLDSSVAQASFGVYFYHGGTAGPMLANGSIICGNTPDGLTVAVGSGPTADAEGNWWGCTGGPGSPGCDTVAAAGGGVVDHDPWIDTITATVGPVLAGQPSVIEFQFYGGSDPDWVYLGEGPGDLHGTPPFTVTTTDGTLTDSDETGSTVHEFVLGASGVLSVTFVPDTLGTATVTLDGPCGLDMVLPLEVETYWVYVPLVMKSY